MRVALMALALFSLLVVSGGAVELPSPIVPNGLGVNIHFVWAPTQDLDMIADAGFGFVRTDLLWGLCEQTQGSYAYNCYDELVAGCAARGIRVQFILDYGNDLYGGVQPGDASWRMGFSNFAAAAAAHFQSNNVVWEIWNEPNCSNFWPGTASQYMDLVQQAVPAIRQADPNSTIIGPALSWYTGTGYSSFMTTCFQRGLLNLVDAVSVHPYRDPQYGPETIRSNYYGLPTYAGLRTTMASYGRVLPIVSSEMGYPTAAMSDHNSDPAAANQRQGDYLARNFLINLMEGIPLSIWYDWKDDGPDPNSNEDTCGTVTMDYQPKPA